jgi:CHAD domain-containing protein
MSFHLKPDGPLGDQVGERVRSELGGALDALREPQVLGLEETVHDVRKRLKRVRSLLRLVRPAMRGGYRRANAGLRDAARDLSPLRDAHALLGAFETLVEASRADRAQAAGVESVRALLTHEAAQAARDGDAERALAAAAKRIEEVRAAIDGWSFDDDRAHLEAGAQEQYRRARRAFQAASRDPDGAAWHEWRKRAKDGREHARMLRALAPSVLSPLAKHEKRLSESLGDDHDLAVLRRRVLDAERIGPEAGGVVALIDAVRHDLQDRSLRLGGRIHAERPRAFGRRLAAYRRAWERLGPERSTGDIAHLAKDPADRPPHSASVVAGGTT